MLPTCLLSQHVRSIYRRSFPSLAEISWTASQQAMWSLRKLENLSKQLDVFSNHQRYISCRKNYKTFHWFSARELYVWTKTDV